MYPKILSAMLALLLCAGCAAAPESETATPPTGTSHSTNADTTKPTSQVPTFQETVLVDNEAILFKIAAIDNDPIWGYTLKAQIENKTDKDLMFALNDTSVNGYMCDPLFAVTVTAGMKANKDISFSKDSFSQIGIVEVTDLEFTLHVYDSQDWNAESVLKQTFQLYPMGQEASKEYPRKSQETDIVLFDDANCTMIVTGFEPDSIWGYCVSVYLVNKTDRKLMFSVGDAAVNGYMCNPYFAQTVSPGKQRIASICWSTKELEELGIVEVESLTLPIRVYDADNWLDGELIDETFTITP